MGWDNGLTDLRDVLSDLYDDKDHIRAIVDVSGVPPKNIDFDGPAHIVWHNVLTEAMHRRKVGAIIEAALREFPENERLQQAADAYYRAQQTGSAGAGAITRITSISRGLSDRLLGVSLNMIGTVVGGILLIVIGIKIFGQPGNLPGSVTATPTLTQTVTATATLTSVPACRVTVPRGLNLRSGPGTIFHEIGSVGSDIVSNVQRTAKSSENFKFATVSGHESAS